MSHIFQRPLCDMGRAFDYSFRPLVGELDPTHGGGCDERPHRVELFSSSSAAGPTSPDWRPFSLCTEHEAQLREYDGRLVRAGQPSRFRGPVPARSA